MKQFSHSTVFLLSLSFVACASPERMTRSNVDPFADPSKFENLASYAYPADPLAAAVSDLSKVPVPSSVSLVDGSTLVSPALAYFPEGSIANREPAGVKKEEEVPSPDSAYVNLIRGNERFASDLTKGERRDAAHRRSLANAEKPFAVVLSCSDSRVPPELIFDQGIGDILSIRVAGNVLGSAQVASIEDAVKNLGVKLIVVMGHESCSAVQSALSPADKHHAHTSPDLDWLASTIRPSLKARGIASAAADDPKFRKPVMANIDSVTESLLVRSAIIGSAVQKGQLKVVRGIYSLESGRVDFWGSK